MKSNTGLHNSPPATLEGQRFSGESAPGLGPGQQLPTAAEGGSVAAADVQQYHVTADPA